MIRKIFLLLIITFPLLSQQIDKEFLESLPDDVRDDVLEKMEAQKELEKPVYRRASSFVDKEIPEENENQLFGSQFFDVMQSSFMPINEPNLDASYVLDFGDILEIQLIGQKSSINEYTVGRDGSINLSDIGKITLAGLSLDKASSLIQAKVGKAYIGTNSFVSLKNIRDINVLISGNAYNPGIYTLNGNSNMLHAISMAGGINEYGSYRDIKLIRNSKVIKNLDIYDVLINGNYNFSSGLRSGDSIVVGPQLKTIAVESGVVRPARYELKDEETFSDILKFSNGYSLNAKLDTIFIKRVYKGINEVIEVNFNEIDTFSFANGDSVFINEYKTNSVLIEGAVINPGTYRVSVGTTLTELIDVAGGYEKSAYPFGGYLENKTSLDINTQSKIKLYDTFLNNLISNANFVSTSENASLGLLLQQLKDADVTGRVIAEFDLDVIKQNKNLDTVLEDGDKIYVPLITNQVYIQGEISNPGATRYSPGKDIYYYISKSGGALDTADLDNLFVIHPNGETTNIKTSSRLSFLQEQDTKLIYPGSIIFVPRDSDFASSMQIASIWAPILSSLALSITSLSVLNNN